MRLLRFKRRDLRTEPQPAAGQATGGGAVEAVIAQLPYYGLASLQRELTMGVWVSPIHVQQSLWAPQPCRHRLVMPRHWAKPLTFTTHDRHLRFWLRVDKKQLALGVRERCWQLICESIVRRDWAVRWAILA